MAECALWYFVHHSAYYELCADEAAAARFGVGMQDAEAGYVVGVQFADGTYIDRDDWPAYIAEEERQWALTKASMARQAAAPKPATREVKAPWDKKRTVIVEADAPSWLGAADTADDANPQVRADHP